MIAKWREMRPRGRSQSSFQTRLGHILPLCVHLSSARPYNPPPLRPWPGRPCSTSTQICTMSVEVQQHPDATQAPSPAEDPTKEIDAASMASASMRKQDPAAHPKRSRAKDFVLIGTVTLAMILNVSSSFPVHTRRPTHINVSEDREYDCRIHRAPDHRQGPRHCRVQAAMDHLRLLP